MFSTLTARDLMGSIVAAEDIQPGVVRGSSSLLPKSLIRERYPDVWSIGSYRNSTWVDDSPEEFLAKYTYAIRAHPYPLMLFFTWIDRKITPDWRWHKWGEYLGKYEPKREHLGDEDPEITGVWIVDAVEVKK